MKNTTSQRNFLFFSTFLAILIGMISPCVKGLVKETSLSPASFPLADYEAHYSIRWHGIDAGKSVHRLYHRGNGQYHFEARTEPKFSFLPFRYLESSNFSWEAGKILPQHYYYNIKEGKRHKTGNVFFDWKTHKLANHHGQGWETTMPEDVQDKLTQTLSLRHALKTGSAHLTYTVAEEDKIKNYSFIILGEEQLKTKLGDLSTIKIENTSRKGNRTTTWLAKNLDYLPVKMEQFRQGKLVASGEILCCETK